MGAPRRARTRRDDVLVWVAAVTLLVATVAAWGRREVAPRLVRAWRWAAPRLAVGLGWAVGAAVETAVAFDQWLDRAHRAVGVVLDRRRAALLDLLAVALLVHLERHWGRWRPLASRLALRAVTATAAAGLLLGLSLAASGPALELVAARVSDGDPLTDLEQRSTIVAADGSALAIVHGGIDRRVVPLDRIPAHVRQAVLAAEDRRFYEHRGYDLGAMARALRANVRASGVVQGGSTITQQLAKQNVVGGERTIRRKVTELVHAVALERQLSKDELLERYLNQVYFGSGAYGVASAAEQFFAKPVEALSPDEAALLAGLIRAPGSFDPRAQPEQAVARRNAVLAAMASEGHLAPGDARAHAAKPLQLLPRRHDTVPLREPHAVEAVKRELLTLPELGATREERTRAVLTGGLRVEVTIRPELQALAGEAVRGVLGERDEGPTAALAAVEPETGRILALHTGTEFAVEQLDLASQGRRQPGSAFKPFVVVAALEHGLDVNTPLEGDSPATFDGADAGEPWTVGNFDRRSHGRVTMREALRDSVNTAFAELALDVGIGPVVDVVQRLGMDAEQALGPPETRGPSIALGGITHGVSPLELAGAYGALLNEGRYARPHLVSRVVGPDGRELYAQQPRPVQALEPEVAGMTHELLRDVVEAGTGTAARIDGVDVAGKTGTTQDSADVWFVGGTGVLSAAVWVGHPDRQAPMPGATGGTVSAQIWRAFAATALSAEQAP